MYTVQYTYTDGPRQKLKNFVSNIVRDNKQFFSDCKKRRSDNLQVGKWHLFHSFNKTHNFKAQSILRRTFNNVIKLFKCEKCWDTSQIIMLHPIYYSRLMKYIFQIESLDKNNFLQSSEFDPNLSKYKTLSCKKNSGYWMKGRGAHNFYSI